MRASARERSGEVDARIVEGGLLALFVVLLAKEAGLPIPIPSDLLMVLAGAQAASGAFAVGELALAVLVAVALGASAQFLLVRAAGRRVVERAGPRVGLDARTLERAAARLRARGAAGVFFMLNVPGARAGVIVAAALAGLRFRDVALGAIPGSSVFHAWHVALGYAIGPAAVALLGGIGALLLVLGALAAFGLAAWFWLRRRGAVRAFTEAACPACLAATVLRERRGALPQVTS